MNRMRTKGNKMLVSADGYVIINGKRIYDDIFPVEQVGSARQAVSDLLGVILEKVSKGRDLSTVINGLSTENQAELQAIRDCFAVNELGTSVISHVEYHEAEVHVRKDDAGIVYGVSIIYFPEDIMLDPFLVGVEDPGIAKISRRQNRRSYRKAV